MAIKVSESQFLVRTLFVSFCHKTPAGRTKELHNLKEYVKHETF